MARLVVTIVGGFWGAGKTSIIAQLAAEARARGQRVAIIENGEPRSPDALASYRRDAQASDVEEWSTLDADGTECGYAQSLLGHLVRLQRDARAERVFLETSGDASLSALTALFSPEAEADAWLCGVAQLESVVTVVNGHSFFDEYCEPAAPLGGAPHAAKVLAEQIEAADRVYVTQAGQLSPTHLAMVEATLRELNPAAQLIVPPTTDRSSHPLLRLSPHTTQDLRAVEHGISSFVFRSRRPFHPERLRAHLLREWPGVLRSRGIFWLATRMSEVGDWSLTGPVWETRRAGFWWAALPRHLWPSSPERATKILDNWLEPYGDRRQEIRSIGFALDERKLTAQLEACLLTEEELAAGPERWAHLPDPFASWNDGLHWSLPTHAPSLLN